MIVHHTFPADGISAGGNWRDPRSAGTTTKSTPKPDPHVQLAQEIGDFLLDDDDVGKINFRVGRTKGRIHITGGKLRDVGRRLKASKLKFTIDDKKLEKRNAGAEFSRGEKKFTFRSGIMFSSDDLAEMPDAMANAIGESLFRGDAASSGLVVHEAVHALLENEGRSLLKLGDESAAYLAETLFHVYRGTFEFRIKHSTEGGKSIFETAHALIVEHELANNPGSHITFLQCRPLRKAIQAQDLYNHLGLLERYR